jgi:hypothetical protein
LRPKTALELRLQQQQPLLQPQRTASAGTGVDDLWFV